MDLIGREHSSSMWGLGISKLPRGVRGRMGFRVSLWSSLVPFKVLAALSVWPSGGVGGCVGPSEASSVDAVAPTGIGWSYSA